MLSATAFSQVADHHLALHSASLRDSNKRAINTETSSIKRIFCTRWCVRWKENWIL